MVDQGSRVAFPLLILLVLLLSLEPSFQQPTRTERAALLELRSSLGIRRREWPRKLVPCLNWTGITCYNGSVTGINISGFKRTRVGSQNPQFAVDALANLTKLSTFNASGFLLPGPIPYWFGHTLVSLQVLDLRSCSVRNAIPGSVGNLTNLTGLYLSDNNLTSMIPSSFGRLVHLSVLDLSRNMLNGSIPDFFASLGNLSSIDISLNSLYGPIPPGIGTLTKLQYLNLSRNGLGSPIPPQLGDLSNLVDLDLSFNSLSGSVPANFQGMRSLVRMLIGSNVLGGPLPPNVFPSSSQLQIVELRQNKFTGAVPNTLWSMARLLSLDISSNNFTGLLPDSTIANVTMAELNMSSNLFYGNLTPALRRFSFVDLSGNYFEGRVSNYVNENASLAGNCLQGVSNQRSLSDCSAFYTERGLIFDNFGLPNTTQPSERQGSRNNHRKVILYASVFGGIGLILGLVFLVLLVLCIRKRGTTNQRGVGVGPVPTATGTSPPPLEVSINFSSLGDKFNHQQLLQATSDFSEGNLIKHGHSGDLFRGILENGFPVVVKRVDLRSVKQEAYVMELEFFLKVSHARLVPFLGHCLDNENEKFLVYRHMPNGDLSSSLYKKGSSDDDSLQSLDWITRLKIATGAAEGLCHLHHECTPPIVHRDVQASSILLDDKFEVRLGSLSEACAQEGDPQQSRITRFLRLPQPLEQGTSGSAPATCAYDVYCFGKVLLELVTGKLGISASSDAQLREWLGQLLPHISMYDKELVTKIVDPSLIIDEDLLEEVWAMAIVARSCLNPKPSRRPPMRSVLKALENPLKVVREENTGSAKLRKTSSRGSWNAALFGSWRHSTSDVAGIPAASSTRAEGTSSFKRSGTSNSQGSGPNGGGEHSSSHRRQSKEIFPEPADVQDVERQDQD